MDANSDSSDPRAVFCAFLRRAAAGEVTVEDWNRHALSRYADPQIEAARRRLVQGGLDIGQCSARPVPAGLEQLAAELLGELV